VDNLICRLYVRLKGEQRMNAQKREDGKGTETDQIQQ